MNKQTVIINRAVPGSGKTTISNCIITALNEHGTTVALHSTDEFFMEDGKYNFDATKLGQFHAQNLADFSTSLKTGVEVVICDNTNLAPWHTTPYTQLARQFHYQVIFIDYPPRELEKHVASQTITLEKPDAHGVPEESLKQKIEEYNQFQSLLNADTPMHTELHKSARWNDQSFAKEITNEPSKHFDLDHLITINPDEYQQAKSNIASEILKLTVLKK